jgi:hypothetical protein
MKNWFGRMRGFARKWKRKKAGWIADVAFA